MYSHVLATGHVTGHVTIRLFNIIHYKQKMLELYAIFTVNERYSHMHHSSWHVLCSLCGNMSSWVNIWHCISITLLLTPLSLTPRLLRRYKPIWPQLGIPTAMTTQFSGEQIFPELSAIFKHNPTAAIILLTRDTHTHEEKHIHKWTPSPPALPGLYL